MPRSQALGHSASAPPVSSQALALAHASNKPPVPPEARLGQVISEFATCLRDLSGPDSKKRFDSLRAELAKGPALCTEHIVGLTEELNRLGAAKHASWRPDASTRIQGFLRRIQQFAAIGDVLIGGSQNLIACGVWAAVRATIEVSAPAGFARPSPR